MKSRFTKKFFKGNREKLIKSLPGSLLVIPAHSILQKSSDTTYPFRQDSNFWYLTGINEPDMLLLIDTEKNESVLLVSEENEYKKEWDGEYDKKHLKERSGIIAINERSDLPQLLSDARKRKLKVGYLKPLDERVEPYGFYSNPARRILEEEIIENGVWKREELIDIRGELAKLRQIKQPEEIAAIQEAIDITAKSLSEVKCRLGEFKTEKDIERAITAGFYDNGGDGHAYEPIVARGKNAATLHYTTNCDKIANSDLLLLDVGSQVNGYAADISRVWSISEPTKRQKEIYEAVIKLQDIAFSLLKPGVKIKEYQKLMEAHVKKAMKQLGCSNTEDKYPHGFSHFLGLDVHDAGDYESPLQENMVLTVEPGIYLPDEGIGIRIEDNILITKTGVLNLSSHIPRSL